jgi:bacterioferritin
MKQHNQHDVVDLLITAYNMEIETVINYLANSIWLDGVRAHPVKESLAAEITEELGHAQRLAKRIKILDGRIPGSQAFSFRQSFLQPPESSVDLVQVIRGVVQAEESAIRQYQSIIDATEGVDLVTQEMAIAIKGDEEEHRRLFVGYLMEVEAMAQAAH